MVRVEVIRQFYDKREHVNRAVGEELEVSAKRLSELNACGVEQGGEKLVREKAGRKPRQAKADNPGADVPEEPVAQVDQEG